MDLANVAALVCKQRDFRLVRDLGAGAHKRAYLSERAGEQFALKVAPITPSLKPRFVRETEALKGCSHVAIAQLRETFTLTVDDAEYWISIEEFLAGGTLAERRPPLTIAQLRAVALTLTDALAHLHDRNLVHRDIKPANILFRSADQAVLTDFGIVRILDAPTLTAEFLPVGPGTPLYAAAEQLLNEMPLIDWRTDQFDLALVIAESALGHHPFSPERDPHLAIGRVARREALPAASREALAAVGFGCLIQSLAPWPVQRYRLPADLRTALTQG
jgi:serine/threonine protein kinase